jgi:hypothetical protein
MTAWRRWTQTQLRCERQTFCTVWALLQQCNRRRPKVSACVCSDFIGQLLTRLSRIHTYNRLLWRMADAHCSCAGPVCEPYCAAAGRTNQPLGSRGLLINVVLHTSIDAWVNVLACRRVCGWKRSSKHTSVFSFSSHTLRFACKCVYAYVCTLTLAPHRTSSMLSAQTSSTCTTNRCVKHPCIHCYLIDRYLTTTLSLLFLTHVHDSSSTMAVTMTRMSRPVLSSRRTK